MSNSVIIGSKTYTFASKELAKSFSSCITTKSINTCLINFPPLDVNDVDKVDVDENNTPPRTTIKI